MEITIIWVPAAEREQAAETFFSRTSRRIGRTFSELFFMVRLVNDLEKINKVGETGGVSFRLMVFRRIQDRKQNLPYCGCALIACELQPAKSASPRKIRKNMSECVWLSAVISIKEPCRIRAEWSWHVMFSEVFGPLNLAVPREMLKLPKN